MDYTRIHRLLRILCLIQSERPWNASALAGEFGAAERTVFRDIRALQQAGVPVEFDRAAGGYRVTGDFFMPPVQLTLDEVLALSALCEHIGAGEQIPFLQPAWRALHKIESQLPPSLRRELAEQREAIAIRTGPVMPPDGYVDVNEKVRQAMSQRRVLRCVYDSARADGRPEEAFDFHPYALFFSVRAWYAVGKRSDRDALRSLKLNRFTRIDLTERRYEPPEDFDLDRYLGNAWRMIRDGDDVEVELWFDPVFAQTVTDTLWHPTQSVQWHADDSCTLTCTVAGLSEIVWWILSMGPHCVVKRPPELAEQVRDLAAGTAAVYRQPRAGG